MWCFVCLWSEVGVLVSVARVCVFVGGDGGGLCSTGCMCLLECVGVVRCPDVWSCVWVAGGCVRVRGWIVGSGGMLGGW